MATILFNRIFPEGSEGKNITVGNEEIKFVTIGTDLFYDTRKNIYYGVPNITSFKYNNITASAAGEIVHPLLDYKQLSYDIGYSGNNYNESYITFGADTKYELVSGDVTINADGFVTWESNPSLNEREAKIKVTITLNGEKNSAETIIKQEGDYILTTEYGDIVIEQFEYPSKANYTANSVSVPTYSYYQNAINIYASGRQEPITLEASGKVTFSTNLNGEGIFNTTNGEMTWRVNNTRAERSLPVTIAIEMNGKTATMDAVCTQLVEDYVTESTYAISLYSDGSPASASGGNVTISGTVTQIDKYYYKDDEVTTYYLDPSYLDIEYVDVDGDSTIELNDGVIEFGSRGTYESSNQREVIVNANYQGATDSITIYQNANIVESIEGGVTTYGAVTAGTITNATVPASGGSATATAGNGSQTYSTTKKVKTYTSGSTTTLANATSGTISISPSHDSISATGSNLGTTVTSQKTLKQQTVTWSANGKSATGTMYIYQQANEYVETVQYGGPYYQGGVTTYGTVTAGSITASSTSDIPASGGTITFTAGNGSQATSTTKKEVRYSYRDKYTSGSYGSVYYGSWSTHTAASTGSVSVSPDETTKSISGSNLGTTSKSRTSLGTVTFTWTGQSSKSASKSSPTIYQAPNYEYTDEYTEWEYSDITDTSLSYPDAAVTGETVSPNYTLGTQTKTPTYVTEYSYSSGESGETVRSMGSPQECELSISGWNTYSATNSSLNSSTGAVTWPSNAHNTSERSSIYMMTVRGENGITKVVQGTSTQLADSYTLESIWNDFSYSYGTVGYEGGTIGPTISANLTENEVWESDGSIRNSTTYTQSDSWSLSNASVSGSGVSFANSRNGTLNWSVNNSSSIRTATVTATFNLGNSSREISVTAKQYVRTYTAQINNGTGVPIAVYYNTGGAEANWVPPLTVTQYGSPKTCYITKVQNMATGAYATSFSPSQITPLLNGTTVTITATW